MTKNNKLAHTSNDNRMSWIRNIDKLKNNDSGSYYCEYEIASECNIPGVLNYQNGMILSSFLTIDKDRNGLHHYTLKIKYAGLEEPYFNREATLGGYFFKDGILGELLAIFSVYFQCRFYLIASYFGELTSSGVKTKTENNFIYVPCIPHIHPPIFSSKNKNFAKGLSDFLESIKSLDAKYHQQFILACYHYAKALKEVGIDSEMVFVRLVSSIEALSKFFELDKKDDLFKGKKFEDVIKNDVLCNKEKEELKKIFNVRKARKKFIRFIENYSTGFFKGGKYRAMHTKIKKARLSKILNAIYDARSSYLHSGEPMYLSQPNRDSYKWKWDIDPSLYTIIDNRKISAAKKLPYTYFFENIVRHCLLSFLKDRITTHWTKCGTQDAFSG